MSEDRHGVLVTGGAGYIGSHIVRRLVAAGHRVVVIDNLSEGHRQAVGDVPLVDADTLSTAVAQAMAGQVGLVTVMLPDPSGYGRICRTEDGRVTGIVEEMGTVVELRSRDDMTLWDGSTGSGTELSVQCDDSEYDSVRLMAQKLVRPSEMDGVFHLGQSSGGRMMRKGQGPPLAAASRWPPPAAASRRPPPPAAGRWPPRLAAAGRPPSS